MKLEAGSEKLEEPYTASAREPRPSAPVVRLVPDDQGEGQPD
jgi:hypothetical protein